MPDIRKIPWLAIALLASLALLAVAYRQNRELRRVRDDLQQRSFQPYVDMWLPEIWTKTVDGSPIRLGTPPARYQVLYFFAPAACPSCASSAPSVRAMAQRLNRDPRVQMVGVADSDPVAARRYAAEQEFRFPVATLSDHRALALFKANSMPLLLVADAQGQVRYWHGGTIEERVLDDALAAMGLAIGNGEPIVIERDPQTRDEAR